VQRSSLGGDAAQLFFTVMQRSFMVYKTQGADWIVSHSSFLHVIGGKASTKDNEPNKKKMYLRGASESQTVRWLLVAVKSSN
jgi:hypothetical protein